MTISTVLEQDPFLLMYKLCGKNQHLISQRGGSPFVYRDGTGWPASLLYIRKIRVSVVICIQSGIVFTKGYLWSKYVVPQNMTKIGLQESC